MRIGGGVSTWGGLGLRLAIALVFAVVLSLFGPPHPAKAASFDCSKAEWPLDKLICATPALSAKDEQMAATYKAALAILSPEGQNLVRDGQRKWLKFVRIYCAARIGQPRDSFGGDAAVCLSREYDERLRRLVFAAKEVGPYLFSEVDDFQIHPSAKDDIQGSRGGFTFRIISYPRIDSPISATTQRWNQESIAWVEHVKKTAEASETWRIGDLSLGVQLQPEQVDFDLGFNIYLAQDDFISLCRSIGLYDHFRAHDYGGYDCHNTFLSANTELTEDQLFKAGTDWQAAIGKQAIDSAVSDNFSPDRVSFLATLSAIPGEWSVTPDALNFSVDVGAEEGNAGHWLVPVTIPWRDLKPYLRDDLPIKLNTD